MKEILRYTTAADTLAGIQKHLDLGDIDQSKADALVKSIQAAPSFADWQVGTMRGFLTAQEQLKRDRVTTDLGGTVETSERSPYAGGPPPVVTTQKKTLTPGDRQQAFDASQGRAVQNDPRVVATTTTAADGTIRQFNKFGALIGTVKGAGKPSATFEKTGAQRTQMKQDLTFAISELKKAIQPGGLIEVQMANGASLKARSVILSTGARWRNVNVPGEQEYKNKGVAYCPHCDGPLFKGKRTAVIGGGNSGIEAAIDLAGIVAHVTVFEFADQLKADAVLVSKLKSLPNVTVHTNAQTTEITGADGKVNGIRYKDRSTGDDHWVELEGVFVQIGLVPNTEFLKGTVELSKFGEIVVDAKGHTNVAGVFAAGDCTTVPYKQIVIAAGEGAKAALSAFDHLIRLPALPLSDAATPENAVTV
jgi:thioredoxin reductase